jgi:hypothetical protein
MSVYRLSPESFGYALVWPLTSIVYRSRICAFYIRVLCTPSSRALQAYWPLYFYASLLPFGVWEVHGRNKWTDTFQIRSFLILHISIAHIYCCRASYIDITKWSYFSLYLFKYAPYQKILKMKVVCLYFALCNNVCARSPCCWRKLIKFDLIFVWNKGR